MSIPNIYAFTYLFTLGGLTVDEGTGGVTRADGSVIPGLYAAGRAAVGLCSNGYLSGMSIGDGMFSGRRAGKAAANADKRHRISACHATFPDDERGRTRCRERVWLSV